MTAIIEMPIMANVNMKRMNASSGRAPSKNARKNFFITVPLWLTIAFVRVNQSGYISCEHYVSVKFAGYNSS